MARLATPELPDTIEPRRNATRAVPPSGGGGGGTFMNRVEHCSVIVFPSSMTDGLVAPVISNGLREWKVRGLAYSHVDNTKGNSKIKF